MCEFEIDFKKLFFVAVLIYVKTFKVRFENGCENDIIWSEIGSGFGEPDGTLPPRISRSTPAESSLL